MAQFLLTAQQKRLLILTIVENVRVKLPWTWIGGCRQREKDLIAVMLFTILEWPQPKAPQPSIFKCFVNWVKGI